MQRNTWVEISLAFSGHVETCQTQYMINRQTKDHCIESVEFKMIKMKTGCHQGGGVGFVTTIGVGVGFFSPTPDCPIKCFFTSHCSIGNSCWNSTNSVETCVEIEIACCSPRFPLISTISTDLTAKFIRFVSRSRKFWKGRMLYLRLRNPGCHCIADAQQSKVYCATTYFWPGRVLDIAVSWRTSQVFGFDFQIKWIRVHLWSLLLPCDELNITLGIVKWHSQFGLAR